MRAGKIILLFRFRGTTTLDTAKTARTEGGFAAALFQMAEIKAMEHPTLKVGGLRGQFLADRFGGRQKIGEAICHDFSRMNYFLGESELRLPSPSGQVLRDGSGICVANCKHGWGVME